MRDSLSAFTTFGIGGAAKKLTIARSRTEFADAAARGALVLGRGSNVLVSDDGYDGEVAINRYAGVSRSGVCVTAASGTTLTSLCGYLKEQGLSGMEWAVGIPSSVGGAVIMNAGAFGGSVSDRLICAEVLRGGDIITLGADEFGFGYRTSSLAVGDVVVSATFALETCDPCIIATLHSEYNAARRAKQPIGRSAGSVFKNHEGMSAGALIEAAGFKGYRIGGAEVSHKHANIIVNTGGATACDVVSIVRTIKTELEARGTPVEEEIVYIGEFN